MAYITVSQLKAAVAAIPAGANAWEVVVPDDMGALAVETGRTTQPDGSTSYTVRGYMDLATLTWTPVA